MFLLSRSFLQVDGGADDGRWASSRGRHPLILKPNEYPSHVWRKGDFLLRVPCPLWLRFSGTWCSGNCVPHSNALDQGRIASGVRFRISSSRDWGCPRIPSGGRSWRWRCVWFQHLAIRNRCWRSLGYGSLPPIRSCLPFQRPLFDRDPSSTRSLRSIQHPPWSKGLAFAGSNRPGALPADLGKTCPIWRTRSIPIRSPFVTRRLGSSAWLAGSSLRWGSRQ